MGYIKNRAKTKSSLRALPLNDDLKDRLLEIKKQQEMYQKKFKRSYDRKWFDIGIHMCEEKYDECGGKLQGKEGPEIAKELLGELFRAFRFINAERLCVILA